MSQGSDPVSKPGNSSGNKKEASHSKANQSKADQSKADQSKADQSKADSKVPKVPAPVSKPGTPIKGASKKDAEPPAFEKGIIDKVVNEFGNKIKVLYIKPLRMKIAVEPADIAAIALYLRDTLGFDHAESVAGTDYPKDNQIEVIYHLGSYSVPGLEGQIVSLTTRTSRDGATLPSLINIFRSVEYHERETYEMLGVFFEGHPRNDRFLLPEDWADIPPLRREFRIKGR
jgi:NADH:ubiquinone oxidoreductase subunit C